jgi:hypothetical protein
MRIVAVVIAALLTLAFAALAAQKVIADGISAARSASFASASAAPGGLSELLRVAEMSDATSVTRPAGATRSGLPTQLAQTNSAPTGIPVPTLAANIGSATRKITPSPRWRGEGKRYDNADFTWPGENGTRRIRTPVASALFPQRGAN